MKRRAWGFSEAAWARGLAWLFAACLAVAATCLAAGSGATSSEAVLAHAAILVGNDNPVPPPDSAPWQAVALPDIWTMSRPDVHGYAWYRMQFDLPGQAQGRQALFTERMRTVGACFVNGVEVGQTGEFGQAEGSSRPRLFEFSPALLHPGRNILHVRLWVEKGWTGALAPVHVGARAPLAAMVAHEDFLHVTVSWMAAAIAGVLGAMMLAIWSARRHDAMFGWLAAAALSKAAYIVSELGVPGLSPGPVQALLGGPMLAPLSIYCLRYAGWRWPRFEALVWVIAIGHGLNLGVGNLWDIGLLPSQVAVQAANIFLFGAPLVITLLICFSRPGLESALLALAHLVSLLLILDLVFLWPTTGIDPNLIHTLPVYLVMAWILTRRFVRSLNEAESLNAELAARVEVKRRELEANYRRLGTLEKQEAVIAERTRLMRDMHDGIGGQLISTLSLVEAGEASQEKVAVALRECIDDLRLAIDSLEPTDDDLVPVLGNLRYRVEPRLRARGIELDWRVQDVPKLSYMTPQNVLNVLRILQEAFTNVLKHAGARHVRVSTRCEGSRVLIDVRDDGRGLAAGAVPAAGHGLANMRHRALALGGDLRLQATAEGTTVTLGLPLTPAQAA
jgi:signal transduction histidine kinase